MSGEVVGIVSLGINIEYVWCFWKVETFIERMLQKIFRISGAHLLDALQDVLLYEICLFRINIHTYIHTLLQLPKEGFSVTRLLIN